MDQQTSHFAKYLRRQGCRWTPERERILHAIFSKEGHFEAEELAYSLRKNGSRVSKATVYRTLPLLVKAGLLNQVIHGEKHQHYERIHDERHHDHLICLNCGDIIEFQDASLMKIEKEICRRNRFRAEKTIVEIFGHCQSCIGRQSKSSSGKL